MSGVRAGLHNSTARPARARSRSTATSATSLARHCPRPTSPKASNGFWQLMAAASNRVHTKLRRARPLVGTFVEIEAEAAPGADLDAAINAAITDGAEVHRLMSFHETDSDISRLNREAHMRPVVVHEWTYQVLQAAIELNRRSGGVFDVTVAPVLQAKGLLPRLVGEAPVAGAPPRDGLELLAGHAVRFGSPDVRIDVGGIAK